MFKKILVPIDGSRTSRLGLEEAIKLAKNQGSMLYLLHVLEERPILQDPGMTAGTYLDDFLESVRQSGKQIVSDAEAAARKAGVRAKSVMVESYSTLAADLIVSYARKLKVDLIVLGTHGRRGLKRLVMGSDAEGVVRNTPVPVLLLRSSAPRRRARATRSRVKPAPHASGRRKPAHALRA